MKRFIITGLIIGHSLSLSAQVGKRTSAYEYLRAYQTASKKNIDDIKSALSNINLASENPKTSNDAKTWLYKAQILHVIYEDPNPAVKTLVPNLAGEVSNAYKMTYKLDSKDDKANEYKRNAIAFSNEVLNEGVALHNGKDYEGAIKKYQSAYDTQKELDKPSNAIVNNWAIALTNLGQNEAAGKLYIDLAQMGVEASKNYALASQSFKDAGKPEEALKYIKEARKVNPDDFELIKAEANFYLKSNQNSLAEPLLLKLKEKGENDPKVLGLLGQMEQEKGNDDKAIQYYKDAIKLDGKDLISHFNIAAMLNNKGVKLFEKATATKDLKAAKTLQKDGEKVLDEASIYFEKCLDLKDLTTQERVDIYNESKKQLKMIYGRLEKEDKFEALMKR